MIATTRAALLAALAGLTMAGPFEGLIAQQVDTLVTPPVAVEVSAERGISPRGAMVRSFALWGWGQAAVGSRVRAGVWFAMEGSTAFMLVRTLSRLGQAKDARDMAEMAAVDSLNALIASDSLEAERLSDPLVFEQAVTDASGVAVNRKLVSARTQQRQDWVTYALFFTLMSGVDAYVNAHLHDFPTTIASEYRRDGSVSLSLRVPVPTWLGGSAGRPASASSKAYPHRRW